MGIGKREFDRLFARERAELESRLQLAGCVEDVYLNEMLGVAFRLPPRWLLRSLQEVARTAEGRLLSPDSEEANDIFRSLTDQFLPIVTISAPTLDDPIARLGPHELGPVAVLQFECHVPGGPVAPFDLEEHVAEDLSNMTEFVAEFEVSSAPRTQQISGADAISYRAQYTMFHADAVEGCPVRERAFYLRQQEYILALRLCDYPQRDARLSYDFDEFVDSLVLR